MRPQKVENSVMLEGLMEVLRTKGFDGATLNDLAAASGLQKASLYHRFPGGKEQIASAVLEYSNQWLNDNIYQVLNDKSLSLNNRLDKVIENIQILYNRGEAICLLRSLSMDNGIVIVAKQIKNEMLSWIAAFSQFGVEFGFEPITAERIAYEGLIKIQGSLVVSKGLGNITAFQEALISIKNSYQQL